MDSLKKRVENIEKRNKRVEINKAWEVSIARKTIITILTYVIITIFLIVIEFPKPFLNSIIPTIAFIISTLTLPLFKKMWVKLNKNP